MQFYRPRSFFTLLLTGFLFVVLPLLTALFSSVQIMDSLLKQGALAVYTSVDRTNSVRRIADLLRDQERKARLYNVLGERALLDAVNQLHGDLSDAFAHLFLTAGNNDLEQLLLKIQAGENYIVAVLNDLSGGPVQRKKELSLALDRYQDVDALTNKLIRLSNRLISDEVSLLRQKVSEGKKTLTWQTSGLIGFSFLFLVLFTTLILRPIRQMDRGIENLGNGDFTTPVRVSGPRDLEALGERLDWLRQRLAELDREKIKMIAHISHELKTPLSSIKEGAGLLRDEVVGPMNASQKDVVAILDKNSNKLQKLIENILDFNMSQAKKEPLQMQELRFDEIVSTVVEDHKNSMLARRITLYIKLAPIQIRGDVEQLKTVVDNLVSNAVKFTPDEGAIRVLLKREGNQAILLVEDTGVGIDREDRSRIFSPFFQGKEAKKAIVKGSGLGLAIAKEYVQNHGGTIRLLSSGSGARFSVVLPIHV
ncbi:MAG: HAMP domain-containing protein [Thermodesulfobacteria bacterium]|nr:HAMP domain-containing protein [Thermodesulfobacteriota bacterium]